MKYQIVPATEDLLRAMAPHIRAADRREGEALGFADPLDGLLLSFRHSEWARVAVTPAGRPIAAWGVGVISAQDNVWEPWMLSTPLVEQCRRDFLRESRRQVAEMLAAAPVLRNIVDGRYRGAVRWLGWLGATFGEPIEIGGAPFLPFELR